MLLSVQAIIMASKDPKMSKQGTAARGNTTFNHSTET
jgi:hypothetical protein